jgi:hypothetical protein
MLIYFPRAFFHSFEERQESVTAHKMFPRFWIMTDRENTWLRKGLKLENKSKELEETEKATGVLARCVKLGKDLGIIPKGHDNDSKMTRKLLLTGQKRGKRTRIVVLLHPGLQECNKNSHCCSW